MVIFINDDVIKERIPAFLNFAKSISDCFTVTREFNGKLPKDKFNKLNNELRQRIVKEDNYRRERFKKDEKYARELKQLYGVGTKKQAVKYFDDLRKEDMQLVTQSRSLTADAPFSGEYPELLSVKYSKETAVKRGGVYEILRFSFGEVYKSVLLSIKDIYDAPYLIGETEFYDLAYYKDGAVKAAISNSGRFIYLDLTKEELADFINIRLTDELCK